MRSHEMFHHAKWVTTPCDTPILKKEFRLDSIPAEAVLTICGLGFFECYLNGQPISDEMFPIPRTEFHWRFLHFVGVDVLNGEPFSEELGHRILCPQYDVASLLKEGANTLELWLAPGWYGYENDRMKRYGPVKACFLLTATAADGAVQEIVSDEEMLWRESFITESNLYGIETQDFTKPEGPWQPVSLCDAPDTEFFYRDCPADKIIRYVPAKLVREADGVRIYDCGVNSTGFPILKSTKAETVSVQFSEELTDEGLLHPAHTYPQRLTWITDGKPRTLRAHFTWVGYRYFAVTGSAEVESCAIVHSDVAVNSDFDSSSEILNWIYKTYLNTQLSNMHCSIPSDCPHLERLGYTGDGQLMCETVMHTLDVKKFYRKWINDIADCQDRKSGHVQYTAPYNLAGGGPGGWGCAIVTVPYRYYLHYGDKSVLEENFDGMLHYFEYLEAHSENNVITSDQQGLWCLGEWCTPTDLEIPEGYVNNYFYILSMERVTEIARLLGREEVIPVLRQRIADRKAAIEANYYDPATGDFCGNVQMANCFALDIGMGDQRTWDTLCSRIEQLGCYDTGIFGTEIVTRMMFERGRADLGWLLLTSEGPYSYFNWKRQNATSFYEYWGEARSHSHPMFGAPVTDLFRSILGIRQSTGSTGFRSVEIAPAVLPGLERAKGHITTESGVIAVGYSRAGDTYDLTVEIPQGVEAVLRMAGTDQKLSPGTNRCTVSV